MLILGLHFGHDASITVLRDGHIAAHVSRERVSGIKHALGLDSYTLQAALSEANVSLQDISYCAITSTQNIELLFDSSDTLSIEYEETQNHEYSSSLIKLEKLALQNHAARLNSSVLPALQGKTRIPQWMLAQFNAFFPAFKNKPDQRFQFAPTMDNFISYEHWNTGLTLDEIGQWDARSMISESNRNAFHYPVTLTLNEHTIPGYFIHHHLCHASASYYLSDFDTAAIFTHDGFSNGTGYNSGLFYYAQQNKIYALAPHHLNIGSFYDQIGIACGLNHIGPAGKLMGLAGYGEPLYYSKKLNGNFYDHQKQGIKHLPTTFLDGCSYDAPLTLSSHWDEEHQQAIIETQKLADIAASAQKQFEETRLMAVRALHGLLQHSQLDTTNLCLSGGTALNCPSNSSVNKHSDFSDVYIEPCCDDGGLSIGAALNLFHNIADQPRATQSTQHLCVPYLGLHHSNYAVQGALENASDKIQFERLDCIKAAAADDLQQQKVIALVSGRSEVGPRALGHRSILADPSSRAMLRAINKIKNREIWRPLAPLVLQDEVTNWFHDGPGTSPYMLYNYRVNDKLKHSAICHIDNTARVQTVDESSGAIFGILSEFYGLSGMPVLLNTSFNGRDAPIVESPATALEVFLQQGIDVLYLHQYRIIRRG